MNIKLEQFEVDFCEEIARQRHAIKIENGIRSRKVDRFATDKEINRIGVISEYAVARALGVGISTEILVHGDGGRGDIVLDDGKTVQVKYASVPGYSFALMSADPRDLKDDYGVLVFPGDEVNEYDVTYWITRDEFISKSSRVNFSYGDRAAIRPYEMNSNINELVQIVNTARTRCWLAHQASPLLTPEVVCS